MGRDRQSEKGQTERTDGSERKQPSIDVREAYVAPLGKPVSDTDSALRIEEACLTSVRPAEGLARRPAEEPRTAGRMPADLKSSIQCMRVSEKGLEVIRFYEGLRLQQYTDAGGQQAIGYGHHIKPGEDFSRGFTRSRANALLVKDLHVARFHVADKVAVPLTQGQYDALVSFVYNVGPRNFANSTLLKKLNSGDYQGAAGEFRRWNKAGTPAKVMRGLSNRREAETEMFTQPKDPRAT